MTRRESERNGKRGGEEVMRALQAEPADRQEAVTPVAGDEVVEETPDDPSQALHAADGDRQESATPVVEAEVTVADEVSGDLEERPGELLRTLRQSRGE